MGKTISKVKENGKVFNQDLIHVLKSMKNLDKAAKDVLLLEKNQTFLEQSRKFKKSDKFNTNLELLFDSNQSILLTLDFVSLYLSEILFKYNISAYSTINAQQQMEAIDGEDSKWGYEVLNTNENQDIWSQFDKILPEFKNDLLRDFDDYSSIHEKSDIKDDEISKFSENISQEKSNNNENFPKRRAGSSNSFKKLIGRKEGMKGQVVNKSLPKKNGIKRSDNISKFSQNLIILKNEVNNVPKEEKIQNKLKKVQTEIRSENNLENKKIKQLGPKSSIKSNNFKNGNNLKKNDRFMSLKSITTLKTMKSQKDIFKHKLSQVFDLKNKEFIKNQVLNYRKRTDNLSRGSPDSKNLDFNPSSIVKMNREELNKYLIEKSKVLSIDNECKKHKNVKTKKSTEDEKDNINEKNYLRIDLRDLEDEVRESNPLNIFKIEKMKHIDDEPLEFTKSPINNNDKTTPITQAQAQTNMSNNKLKFTPTDLNSGIHHMKGKSFLSDKNTIISKDKNLYTPYNKSEKNISYKKLLKGFRREDQSKQISNFNDDFDIFKRLDESSNNASSYKINNVNKNRKSSFGLTKMNVFNNNFHEEISKNKFISDFPKYNLDLSPLKFDLPYNHVVKLFKNNNKFLFKNTNEDKDLINNLRSINLETFEKENLY